MKIALIANDAFSLVRFRGPFIERLVKRGVSVFALAPNFDCDLAERLVLLGAQPVSMPFAPKGMNPVVDLAHMFWLVSYLRRNKIDSAFALTLKPAIFATFAASLAGVPARYALIAGLGRIFSPGGQGSFQSAKRAATSWMLRIALTQSRKVIVQNEQDRSDLIAMGVPSRSIVKTNGTGVDLAHFPALDPSIDPVTFLFLGRLLKEKGIFEYAAAAAHLKRVYPDARFLVAGRLSSGRSDPGPKEIESWREVEWMRHVEDVSGLLARVSVVVLPSYYREGVPRSLIEAAASARPIVTTDSPGCRDTVLDGRNGFLVPAQDIPTLTAKMQFFLDNPEKIASMGQESRTIAEERFDINAINAAIERAMGLE